MWTYLENYSTIFCSRKNDSQNMLEHEKWTADYCVYCNNVLYFWPLFILGAKLFCFLIVKNTQVWRLVAAQESLMSSMLWEPQQELYVSTGPRDRILCMLYAVSFSFLILSSCTVTVINITCNLCILLAVFNVCFNIYKYYDDVDNCILSENSTVCL